MMGQAIISKRQSFPRLWRWLAAVALVAAVLVLQMHPQGNSAESAPHTGWHYAPNSNFDAQGHFVPSRWGFNLADVGSPDQTKALGPGIQGLVWVGQCRGVDDTFLKTVQPFIGNDRLFGFFLMDDPDPVGLVQGTLHRCDAANLKAESDWLHDHMPNARTFVILMNMSNSRTPAYSPEYRPAATDIDLYGLAPYPCRTELNGSDYAMIDRYVHAAEVAGFPRNRIIPVYQAFGGGKWEDDGHGTYVLPTAAQLCRIMRRWQMLIPPPAFDVAYSWGVQQADTALEGSPRLQDLFSRHNRADPAACFAELSDHQPN